MLTPDELERHRRHILLKEIGGPGVAKLKSASVSIIGAGALGGPCALYLAAAGLGHIEIWDDDTVDLSNLQRQVQFVDADCGAAKTQALAARLHALNPGIEISQRKQRFTPASAPAGSILIDASDNYQTRFALNQLAHDSKRALVSGAAMGWQGQASVFASGVNAKAPCYRCLVPSLPPDADDCSSQGVVGAVTGMVGARMALEAVKQVTGAGETLIGRLWLLDGLNGTSRTINLRPDSGCAVCGH